MFLHEPGFELALFLKATRQRGGIGYLASNEFVVFALNILVWMALLLIGSHLLKGIAHAWRRSRLLWAFLIAIAVSVVGELTTYDNYWLPGLPYLSRPGWSIAPRVAPITSFVMDLRTPLDLLAYPDLLLTISIALVVNIVFWTLALYTAARTLTSLLRRSATPASA